MFDTNSVEKDMQAVLDRFKDELKKVRTGRAHPDMIADIKVEAYGQFSPLNQIANISVSGASLLQITPYDPKLIPNIENAIRSEQSLGLNPADDGRVVRVPVPPLTEERRKEIVKVASTKVEDAKISLRKVRDEARRDIKNSTLSEDQKRRAEKTADTLTQDFAAQIDATFKLKQAEIEKI